ncbi:hypothetical protein [Streptomonospora salina]|uniref:Uncharacterized protein n=1 Tax=Streptomonospora salina TaxID=104205 RepID=A0A841DYP2_9ACTN|nr:hypothetical protein [Streptomonospora salina]MBB5996577.1 hypothetical protein [Streptomonospora salina]
MAARKKSKRTSRPGKGAQDIHLGPTRDPGPTGSVGCSIVLIALVVIGVAVVLLETLG